MGSKGTDDRLSPEECLELRKRDEKLDWQNIPVEDLYRCSSSLSFFDAEGMRFHFPQFLLFELDFFQQEEERLYTENKLLGCGMFTIGYATDNNWTAQKFDLFNIPQIQVIIDFITLKMQEFETAYKEMCGQYGCEPESFVSDKNYKKPKNIQMFWKNFET